MEPVCGAIQDSLFEAERARGGWPRRWFGLSDLSSTVFFEVIIR